MRWRIHAADPRAARPRGVTDPAGLLGFRTDLLYRRHRIGRSASEKRVRVRPTANPTDLLATYLPRTSWILSFTTSTPALTMSLASSYFSLISPFMRSTLPSAFCA